MSAQYNYTTGYRISGSGDIQVKGMSIWGGSDGTPHVTGGGISVTGESTVAPHEIFSSTTCSGREYKVIGDHVKVKKGGSYSSDTSSTQDMAKTLAATHAAYFATIDQEMAQASFRSRAVYFDNSETTLIERQIKATCGWHIYGVNFFHLLRTNGSGQILSHSVFIEGKLIDFKILPEEQKIIKKDPVSGEITIEINERDPASDRTVTRKYPLGSFTVKV